MTSEFPLITTDQYKYEATKWLNALNREESVSVLFIPKTDRIIRLGQLLNDQNLIKQVLGKESTYFFQRIDFEAHDLEDIEDLKFQLGEQLNLSKITASSLSFNQWMDYFRKNSSILVLILPEAEKYLNPAGKTALGLISQLIDTNSPIIRIISFFEANITHPSLLTLLPTSARLYENIVHYPLYTPEDSILFINLLCNQWNVSVNKETVKKIIVGCGGHLWLIKDAIRRIAATGKWSGDDEGMMFRLRSIYNLLLPSEQNVIKKLIMRKSDFSEGEKLSLAYLKKMRFINDHNQSNVEIFRNLILSHEELSGGLSLQDNHILVNNVPVDKFFSRKEYRVFKLLLENKGIIITRDQISQRVWPTNTQEHYSDWAIDQLIARIRKRMIELSLPPKLLRVVRGRGYLLKPA